MAITTIDYTVAGDYRRHQSVRYDGTIVLCPVCHRIGAILRERTANSADTLLTITHTVRVYSGPDSPAPDHTDVRVLVDKCHYEPPASSNGAAARPT